ncbi:MAG: HAD family hydrolase [Lachnospiraceae bacterium]|nr:HAD family hydrolase [Lachnospiraceae bacterium]
MYKNYIFDFYGTLADIRTDEESPFLWNKISEIYSAMGACYSPEELKERFRFLEREESRRIGGEDAEPDLTKVFALLYQEKGAACDRGQAKMTAVTFRALSRKFIRAYDGVKELLEELRQRDKKVYLLSNAQTDFTRPEIEMLGLTPYFDGIFISSEQGCKKPSAVFFERLLSCFALDPGECIMIGNDESADIVGAQKAGMDSLYIHTEISPKEYGKVQATYRVMDGDFRKIRDLVLGKTG